MIVVVAASADGAAAETALESAGATETWHLDVGRGRVLVYGGGFEPGPAATAAATLRRAGWPADVRPVEGGHLRAWHTHTAPVVVDGRLWICFPWSEFDRSTLAVDTIDLVEIDPDGAFGTGAHPSTRLVLDALASLVRCGDSVLDYGCGSGVLAVCAARLGAAPVYAVDINPVAVAATRRNAARNEVAVSIGPARCHVVVANIGAVTLVELAPVISDLVVPGGWVVLSGMSPAQTSVVAAAYRPLRVVETPAQDDWAAIILSAG